MSTHLDVVDRVDVLHAVDDNLADLLQTLVPAHRRNRISLHQHVALSEKLDSLRGVIDRSACATIAEKWCVAP